MGATYCESLDELLQWSDFVLLAVGLTPQTQRLIGKRELSLMKPTAILINIGRGTVSTERAPAGLDSHVGGSVPAVGLLSSAFLLMVARPKMPCKLAGAGGGGAEFEGVCFLFRNIPDFCFHIILKLKVVTRRMSMVQYRTFTSQFGHLLGVEALRLVFQV